MNQHTYPVISRNGARLQGFTRFFTGKTCKHGHLAQRHVSSGSCCECQRLYLKKYGQTEQRKEARRKSQQRYQKSEKGRLRDLTRYAENPHRSIPAIISIKYPEAVIPLTDDAQKRVVSLYRLAYALRQRTGESWDVDHCYPLARGGVHHPDNLMVLPSGLNRKKSKRFDHTDPVQMKGLVVSMLYRAV
ncbi:hypothetical protein [Aeromonas hydrophila]|uniref:hypothetical protein n=1 Tax=Aeromonas hydrophila TaxID=644 RepID=UPI00235E6862|nr:hypothetical protein [Aeromonas hydrophila]